jgi:cytoplasmic iron level regulating protein YaaA (DUF328/UPF0246 family)
MPALVVLLPHSEGKAAGGSGPPLAAGVSSFPELDRARLQVLRALGAGVRKAPTRPAIERFTGVLYKELAWTTLPAPARRRGASSLLIVNALGGLSTPADPLPDFRLKLSASLPPLGRLAAWWKPRLTAVLAERLAGAVVWDLLPNEHAAAWDPAEVATRRRVTVRFVDRNGVTVSHWNKLLKGALVREVLTRGLTDPRALAGWEHPSGYGLDLDATVGDALVFAERT